MNLNSLFNETLLGSDYEPSNSGQQSIQEPQPLNYGTSLNDMLHDTALKPNGDFLQLYSQMRHSIYASTTFHRASEEELKNGLTREQLDKTKSIIVTYRHLKAQYEKNTAKYKTYKEDLSKNEVLKNEIMTTKAKFLTILNDLEPLEDKKKSFETASMQYDDERIELITQNMNRLNSKILELGEILTKLDEQLGFIRGFYNELLNEVIPVEKRVNTLCTICMDKKVDKVVIPCGHTFCGQCIEQAEQMTMNRAKKCGICRTAYSQCITIYL